MNLRAPLLVVVLTLLAAAPASAGPPQWAPASSASIHPGVQMYTDGGQCTANFVFYDATDVYIGFAAHCAEDSDGAVGSANSDCTAKSFPLGTPVEIDGASEDGTLVYSSYETMPRLAETRREVCRYNDFAVVRIAAADRDRVNPSMPFWGGPTGLRQTTMAPYEKVVSFGNSGLRGGIEELSPKEGYTLGENAEGMSHHLWTATPGIFGDSGSGYLDGSGNAFGIASTISALTTNNASDLAFAMDYMHKTSPLRLWLALGTEPFAGPLAGEGLSPSPGPQPQPDPGGGEPAGPAGGDPAPGGQSQEPSPPPSRPSPPPSGGTGPASKDSDAPRVSIGRPARSRRALRRLTGRAAGAAKVEISIAVRHGRRCYALAPSRRFTRRCLGNWVTAAGTSRWSLKIRGLVPPGRYTIRARALDSEGRLLAQATRRARPR